MRERIFQIVQRARPGDKVSHAYDIFIVAVAFLSIIPLMFRPQDSNPQLNAVLNMVDIVTVYILFLDYILRWMTQDLKTGKRGWREFAKYPFTPLALIDLLAILPSLGVLPESFKFLRVLRVTKMFRYSKNLTIVANVFRSEKNTLLAVLVVALMYIFVSGLIMFVNEPDTFDNFFDSLYWATTALTTVGYGDVYPTTDLGKFISMASSLFGIAVIALPAGIITGGFLEQIRQSQEDREAYFHGAERKPWKGRTLGSYGGVRAYAQAHPKVVAYVVTMAACVLVNEGLYALAGALGLPLWLDTTGTALAAILLEPAAGLVVGFVNNLVLAVQMGNAGNLLYYCLSAISALAFGSLFARGKKITLRSVGWAALLVVGAESVISCALAFSLSGGALTTAAEQAYGAVLASWGLPPVAVVLGALLVDKLLDTAAVFVIVLASSRLIVGSRIDPLRFMPTDEAVSRATGATTAEWGDASSEAVATSNAVPAVSAAPVPHILGIDVGATFTKVGAFTAEGELVGTHLFNSQSVLADGSHAQLARELQAAVEKSALDAQLIQAVGLAVPGAVASEDSLKLCPHIDLDLRSYKALLRSLFPQATVAVLNDADAAVLGDQWRGTSNNREQENVVFVTLGTGVSAGVLVKGQPFSGVHGAVGEIGHMCVDPNEDEPCACGRTGCLEQYASATGLVHQARKESMRAGACEEAAREAFPDARAVLEAAVRRDPAARAALSRFSDALGYALAQMACMVDPDVFVLGGGLSECADQFLGDVRARYRACALSVCRDTPIEVSSLGNECGMYGAARCALGALANAKPHQLES